MSDSIIKSLIQGQINANLIDHLICKSVSESDRIKIWLITLFSSVNHLWHHHWATAPSTVFNKYGSLLSAYLRLEQTMEPSLKPTVRRSWLSAENTTLPTPPRPQGRHCSWTNWSCKDIGHRQQMRGKYSSSVLKEQTRRSTIEAVSRTHNEPSRPAEASHKWWGDRARQAGPKGWPRTSCSGFSGTTCGLKGPSVPWAGGNRQTQQWLKTCLTTKLPSGHRYSHGMSQERPRHAG